MIQGRGRRKIGQRMALPVALACFASAAAAEAPPRCLPRGDLIYYPMFLQLGMNRIRGCSLAEPEVEASATDLQEEIFALFKRIAPDLDLARFRAELATALPPPHGSQIAAPDNRPAKCAHFLDEQTPAAALRWLAIVQDEFRRHTAPGGKYAVPECEDDPP
jgi:hypothetical protein